MECSYPAIIYIFSNKSTDKLTGVRNVVIDLSGLKQDRPRVSFLYYRNVYNNNNCLSNAIQCMDRI